jgi:tripartite-type tricarboxylate transporter receptor subunit TctC
VVSTDKRATELPDVPSMSEAGFKDGVSTVWIGVFMPSKTPRDIVDKVHAAGLKVLAEPAMQASLKKLGVEPYPLEPAEMDRLVAGEVTANMTLLKDVK